MRPPEVKKVEKGEKVKETKPLSPKTETIEVNKCCACVKLCQSLWQLSDVADFPPVII